MNRSPASVTPYTDAQRREAAEWFVVIWDEDDPNAETLQSWLRWMEAAEGNRLAFEAVAQAWHAMPVSLASSMPSAGDLLADRYFGDKPISEWLSSKQESAAAAQKTVLSGQHRRARWAWAASAAAIALVLY